MTPAHPSGTSICLEQIDELPCLRIQHPHASALIALQGAQLLEYIPNGQQPVIWLSETAGFKTGKSVRGGIPVCWPWFGDLARNPEPVQSTMHVASAAPAHGWVRNLPWLLERAYCDLAAAHLSFRFPAPLGLPVAWNTEVDLHLNMHIGDELQLVMSCINRSQQPLVLSQALHSYFAVSHIDQVSIDNLEQVNYVDTLRDWQLVSADAPVKIDQEVDRIYLNTPGTILLRDNGWQRTIAVRCEGSHSAVVWNPWIEKAKRLSDFADDAYQRMLCIESARVLDDCLKLEPGQTARMELTVSIAR